jgi:membrane associated rhomboid family serine protease
VELLLIAFGVAWIVVIAMSLRRRLRLVPGSRRPLRVFAIVYLLSLVVATALDSWTAVFVMAGAACANAIALRLALWWGFDGHSAAAVSIAGIARRLLPSANADHAWLFAMRNRAERLGVDSDINALVDQCPRLSDHDREYLVAVDERRYDDALIAARQQRVAHPNAADGRLRAMDMLSMQGATLEHLAAVDDAQESLLLSGARGRAQWLLSSLAAWGQRDAVDAVMSGQLRSISPVRRAAIDARLIVATPVDGDVIVPDHRALGRLQRLVMVERHLVPPPRWISWTTLVLTTAMFVVQIAFVGGLVDDPTSLEVLGGGGWMGHWDALPKVVLSADQWREYNLARDQSWVRLASSLFVHFSTAHLVINVVGFLWIGRRVEWFLGRLGFVGVFVGCGAMSTLLGGALVGPRRGFSATQALTVCALVGVLVGAQFVAARRHGVPWRWMSSVPLVVVAASQVLLNRYDNATFVQANVVGALSGLMIGVATGFRRFANVPRRSTGVRSVEPGSAPLAASTAVQVPGDDL